MNILITGSSSGIGRECAIKFLHMGHEVFGVDIQPSTINHTYYKHFIADVADASQLPEFDDIDVVVNNAGCQNRCDTFDDIDVNLRGVINCTKKYVLFNPNIKSVLNLASVSAHNGAEFGEYVASKGGVLSYTVWTAKEIARFGATCNSLSFGGVTTDLNSSVLNDEDCWNDIMSMTPLKKWATAAECAEWIYFFTVINRSCSGQDLVIDNLETFNHRFVWS